MAKKKRDPRAKVPKLKWREKAKGKQGTAGKYKMGK